MHKILKKYEINESLDESIKELVDKIELFKNITLHIREMIYKIIHMKKTLVQKNHPYNKNVITIKDLLLDL